MTIAESYTSLARMLDYPKNKEILQADSDGVSGFLLEHDFACPLVPFAGFVARSTLADLQEDYVATFDFNPAVAPYLGHHLYGDNQKKGAYMIMIKQEFARHEFTPLGNELPDHLPLVLGFLAHLAQQKKDRVRQAFISESILPGLERLNTGFADRQNSPWKAVVEAAKLLCAADTATCEEEKTC